MTDRELGLFLRWFIKHYSTETTTDRGLLYYANAMGEEVSIAEILEHYNETFNTNQENLQDSTNGYTYYPQEYKTVFNTKMK